MSAPFAFGTPPADSVVDLGPSLAPCPHPHFNRDGKPREVPAHRFLLGNGEVVAHCDSCARSRWPQLFSPKGAAKR